MITGYRIFSVLLLSVYPVVYIYTHNLGKVELEQLWAPVILILASALLLFGLIWLFIRDGVKAGFLSTLFFLMFFTYKHLIYYLKPVVATEPYILIILLLIYIFILILITGKKDIARGLTIFSIAATVLLSYSAFQIISFEYFRIEDPLVIFEDTEEQTDINRTYPDIYYIILDGYGRSDILQEIYSYDNSDFIEHLRDKGFFVGDRSKANYCQTGLSLASSLNFIYLDSVAMAVGVTSSDRFMLLNLIRYNRIMNILKKHNYKIVTFPSGYSLTELKEYDYYLSSGILLSEFHNVLLNFTPVNTLLKIFSDESPRRQHAKNILHTFEAMGKLRNTPYPKFIFTHIISPHPPFIFDEEGMYKAADNYFYFSDGNHFRGGKEEYIKNYKEQAAFVSKKVKILTDNILSNNKDAVIIIQSDHGPGSALNWDSYEDTDINERFSILNAVYFPDSAVKYFYPGISPVNTFRIILNNYFGKDYELLKDESFYSTWSKPYNFIKTEPAAPHSSQVPTPP
jgi:hypothetical protein